MAKSEQEAFFKPRNIALVGASDRSAWSAMVFRCFELYEHKGKLSAVNRGGKPAHGLPGYTSCTEIEDPVDAAFIYVPAEGVLGALEDAAAAGIRNAVILSSGFAEAGKEGAAMQEEVVRAARDLGIRFMGPNSMGFANLAHGSAMTSVKTRLPCRHGRLALISQSGALLNEMGKIAHLSGIGLAFTGATGNEASMSITDLLEYLVDDDSVGAICIYSEGIRDHGRFMAAAMRAKELNKPIVLLKLGRSEISGAIAQAHTGSLIGDDGVFDAMCRQTGIIRVSSLEEAVTTADLLGKIGPIAPARIAMCSISGGACALFADLSDEYGVEVVQYTQETKDALRAVLPSFASTLNPLDTTGALVQHPEIWHEVIPILARDANTGLVIVSQPIPNTDAERLTLSSTIEAIVAGFRAANKPAVIVDFSVQTRSSEQIAFIKEAGVDVPVQGLDIAVRALAHLQRWSERVSRPAIAQDLPAPCGEHPVGERETLQYLSSRGAPVIPARLVATADEAAQFAEELGGRAAYKIASPDIAHKTEANGVRLDIAPGDAKETFASIVAAASAYDPSARVEGVLIAPMRDAGTEMIVGVTRDPEWGLAITVGTGGVLTEILEDSETRLLPIDEAHARDMVLSLKGAKLLQGFRGSEPADLDALCKAIVAIGDAAAALGPDIAALEVNPLRVSGAQVEALDALAIYAA
ncbi:MAG: acetate--CoA ligase family protein [Sphingomonadaceae bacterium]|nr:acetate--CoA ligase family protein [Sphingomonadaceae bacterium]